MHVYIKRGLLCGVLLFGATSLVAANTGDKYQAGANFSAAKKMKAASTPVLRAVISIPPDIQQGDTFVVNCQVEATKNPKGAAAR